MTFRQVTILFFYNTNNIFLTQKQDSPKKKERKIQDYVSKKKKNYFESYSYGVCLDQVVFGQSHGLAWVMMLLFVEGQDQGRFWIRQLKVLENRGGRC